MALCGLGGGEQRRVGGGLHQAKPEPFANANDALGRHGMDHLTQPQLAARSNATLRRGSREPQRSVGCWRGRKRLLPACHNSALERRGVELLRSWNDPAL